MQLQLEYKNITDVTCSLLKIFVGQNFVTSRKFCHSGPTNTEIFVNGNHE